MKTDYAAMFYWEMFMCFDIGDNFSCKGCMVLSWIWTVPPTQLQNAEKYASAINTNGKLQYFFYVGKNLYS